MSRVWFAQELETVATYWRIYRADGVALGFTSHNEDLWFEGICHLASPGMLPAAIRRTGGFEADSAKIDGAISHGAIQESDLGIGRFDGARVIVGLVDWESLENEPLYSGRIGGTSQEAQGFVAQLQSRKAELERDPVPRTSPNCRASFCGKGCGLSAAGFEHEALLLSHDPAENLVSVSPTVASDLLIGGSLRWVDGPYAGIRMGIMCKVGSALLLDQPIDKPLANGLRVVVREGCDRSLATCAGRFGNAVNFQGEPFLPGNDLLVRYGTGL